MGTFLIREFRSAEEASSIVMFGVLFGITAGIMTEVAIKSLLLEAARYDPEDRVVSKVSTCRFFTFQEFTLFIAGQHSRSTGSIIDDFEPEKGHLGE